MKGFGAEKFKMVDRLRLRGNLRDEGIITRQ